MVKNAPFKFTREQRNSLIDSWKRKADRQIAAKKEKGYIDTVERIVRYNLIDPSFPPEDRTPQEERDDNKKMLGLSRQLHGALVNQSAGSMQSLNGQLSDIAQSQDICRDYLSLPHLVNSLESLEFALKLRLKHNTPSTARKGDSTRYIFMVALVTTYQRSFGKNPSASPAGNFRAFLDKLSNIIGIPLGSDLLKRVIADFKI